ncbi:MAG: hypothetical protein AB7T49_03955 [Oligoflexales bacterium]
MNKSNVMGAITMLAMIVSCSNGPKSKTNGNSQIALTDLTSAHLYKKLNVEAQATGAVFPGSGEELEKKLGAISCLQASYFDEMAGKKVIDNSCSIAPTAGDEIFDEESKITVVGETAKLVYANLSQEAVLSSDVFSDGSQKLVKAFPGTSCSEISGGFDEASPTPPETVYDCEFSKEFSNEKMEQKLAKVKSVSCVDFAEINAQGGVSIGLGQPEALLLTDEILILTVAGSTPEACFAEIKAAVDITLVEVSNGNTLLVK